MPIVDRLEYPKKYKLKNTLIYLAVLAALAGLLYSKCSNEARRDSIIIHSVGFDEYDRNFIRLGYDIENKGRSYERADLLAKVYDAEGEELASIFFATELRPQTREFQSKVIDKLNRPLKEGEKPYRATIELRQRKLLSY